MTEENNKILKQNNRMLKKIMDYIYYVTANSDEENANDFVRNIVANMASNMFPFGNRK